MSFFALVVKRNLIISILVCFPNIFLDFSTKDHLPLYTWFIKTVKNIKHLVTDRKPTQICCFKNENVH